MTFNYRENLLAPIGDIRTRRIAVPFGVLLHKRKRTEGTYTGTTSPALLRGSIPGVASTRYWVSDRNPPVPYPGNGRDAAATVGCNGSDDGRAN